MTSLSNLVVFAGEPSIALPLTQNTVIATLGNTTPGSTLTLDNTFNGMFKIVGNVIQAGAACTRPGLYNLTGTETLAGAYGSPSQWGFTVRATIALAALTLSASSFAYNVAAGTTVATITGKKPGSTLELFPNDGRLLLTGDDTSGWKIVRGLSSSDGGVIAVSLRETFEGVVGAYRNTTFNITSVKAAPVTPPAGFSWDFASYPFSVLDDGLNYSVVVSPRDWVPGVFAAPLATGIFHVDPVSGNDTTGTGIGTVLGDFSVAVKSLSKAITLGNATLAPFRVIAKPGIYNRALIPNGLGGTIFPTQNCTIEGFNGRAIIHSADAAVWTDDGSGTNTYSSPIASHTRAFDMLNTATDGVVVNYTELTRVADQATVQTTLGAVAQVGGTVYVRRTDLLAPSDTNTRVLRGAAVCKWDATSKSVFLKNCDFEGGTTNCLDAVYAATRNIVAEDCSFKYSGSYNSTGGNSIAIDLMVGIACFTNCIADMAPTDAFNGHSTGAGVPPHLMTIGCRGFNTGIAGNTSCNLLTIHENVRAFDFGGFYSLARGGTIRNIGQSVMWTVSPNVSGDRGDGSTLGEIVLSDNARAWAYRPTVNGTVAYSLSTGAILYVLGGNVTGAKNGAGKLIPL